LSSADRNRPHQEPLLTPIGWVVCVITFGTLACLLIQALTMSSKKSATAQCMHKARWIAHAVLTYSANWPDCTIEDPDFYVKLFGYPLNTERGWCNDEPPWYTPGAKKPTQSQVYASEVKDFVCPVDTDPGLNTHGYPSSYRVHYSPRALRAMILDRDVKSSRLVLVSEIGNRHPIDNKTLGGFYVFADGHSELLERAPTAEPNREKP